MKLKKNYQDIQGPKVSADPSLEGNPSGRDVKKEISGKITSRIKELFGGKKEGTTAGTEKEAEGQKYYQGQQTEKLFDPKDLFTNMSPQKAIKLVGLAIIVIVIVGAIYVRFIRTTPIRNETTIVTPPTPTYSPYQKFEPSIYASDPEFKSIEEAMNVLTQEATTTPLKETTLEPPNLDYKIEFKGIEVD
ncbi:MAG TPA: hypothetical protein VI819_00475 [Patescibacteria group bacterium]|nr:hypothetical protein [Patescibacteria group bacterium]